MKLSLAIVCLLAVNGSAQQQQNNLRDSGNNKLYDSWGGGGAADGDVLGSVTGGRQAGGGGGGYSGSVTKGRGYSASHGEAEQSRSLLSEPEEPDDDDIVKCVDRGSFTKMELPSTYSTRSKTLRTAGEYTCTKDLYGPGGYKLGSGESYSKCSNACRRNPKCAAYLVTEKWSKPTYVSLMVFDGQTVAWGLDKFTEKKAYCQQCAYLYDEEPFRGSRLDGFQGDAYARPGSNAAANTKWEGNVYGKKRICKKTQYEKDLEAYQEYQEEQDNADEQWIKDSKKRVREWRSDIYPKVNEILEKMGLLFYTSDKAKAIRSAMQSSKSKVEELRKKYKRESQKLASNMRQANGKYKRRGAGFFKRFWNPGRLNPINDLGEELATETGKLEDILEQYEEWESQWAQFEEIWGEIQQGLQQVKGTISFVKNAIIVTLGVTALGKLDQIAGEISKKAWTYNGGRLDSNHRVVFAGITTDSEGQKTVSDYKMNFPKLNSIIDNYPIDVLEYNTRDWYEDLMEDNANYSSEQYISTFGGDYQELTVGKQPTESQLSNTKGLNRNDIKGDAPIDALTLTNKLLEDIAEAETDLATKGYGLVNEFCQGYDISCF